MDSRIKIKMTEKQKEFEQFVSILVLMDSRIKINMKIVLDRILALFQSLF